MKFENLDTLAYAYTTRKHQFSYACNRGKWLKLDVYTY